MSSQIAVDDILRALSDLRANCELAEAEAGRNGDYHRVTFELARKLAIADVMHEIHLIDIRTNYNKSVPE